MDDRFPEPRARRFKTSIEATLAVGDARVEGRLADITVRGACFEGADRIEIGQGGRLDVAGMSCPVRIAWVREGSTGFEFTDPFSQSTLNVIRRALR